MTTTTQGPDRDKILDRVRKLWRKAESCEQIGSLAEAEAFADAVAKMMATHKLSEEEVKTEQKDKDDPMGMAWVYDQQNRKSKRIWWQEQLAGVIAREHYCKHLIVVGSNTQIFVGREADREVAVFVFESLKRLAGELCMQGYWKARYTAFKNTGTYDTGDFKDAFMRGFVDRIAERFRETREAMERAAGTGKSLVLVRRKSFEEIEKWMADDRGGKKGKTTKQVGLQAGFRNRTGYEAGRTAANAARLGERAVKETKNTSAGALPRGA